MKNGKSSIVLTLASTIVALGLLMSPRAPKVTEAMATYADCWLKIRSNRVLPTMSDQTFAEITDERLGAWTKRLKASNSTPLVLVGMGHEKNAGELTVCVPAGIPDDMIIASLKWVIKGIEAGAVPKGDGESNEWIPKP